MKSFNSAWGRGRYLTTSSLPATPKPNFLTAQPTEGERPKLKRNFFHNWADSTHWTPQDLAMMTPEQKEGYERRLLRERPKYIPKKIAKLSSEDRQEYENSLNILQKLINNS